MKRLLVVGAMFIGSLGLASPRPGALVVTPEGNKVVIPYCTSCKVVTGQDGKKTIILPPWLRPQPTPTPTPKPSR